MLIVLGLLFLLYILYLILIADLFLCHPAELIQRRSLAAYLRL